MSKFTEQEIAIAKAKKQQISNAVVSIDAVGKSVDEITNEVKLRRKAEAEKNGLLCVDAAKVRFREEEAKVQDQQDYPEYFYDEGYDMLYKLIRTVKPSTIEGEPDTISIAYKYIA